MATTVTFYNFSKKSNSTAVPSTGGTALDCFIKEATSTYNPTFVIESTTWPSYTYVYWSPYYYFVNDTVSIGNNLYEISCSIDPLSSWRSEILSMNTFVERSQSNYNDYLIDNELSVNQEVQETSVAVTTLKNNNTNLFDGTGCYIIRCVSEDASSVTGIGTYVVTAAQLASILSFLFNDSGTIWEAAWDTVAKTVFNPFQYIVSVKYCAISYSIVSSGCPTTSNGLKLGWWNTGLTTIHILDYIGSKFTASLNEIGSYYGDFRDTSPNFTKYKILLPASGLFDIPSINMKHGQQLAVNLYVDYVTGKSSWYIVYNNTNYVLFRVDANVCADVQIGQVSRDLGGAVGSTIGAVGMGLSGNPIGATLGGINALGNILQPQQSLNGNMGSIMELASIQSVILYAERYATKASYHPITRGRPLNENVILSSLSGFCQCGNASVTCNAPLSIKNQINNMLNTGFYIE